MVFNVALAETVTESCASGVKAAEDTVKKAGEVVQEFAKDASDSAVHGAKVVGDALKEKTAQASATINNAVRFPGILYCSSR